MNIREQPAFSKWRDCPRWLQVLAIIAVINFATYIIVDMRIGGDAMNGYIQNGSYYLGSHGRYTVVTKTIWTYSYYHTIAVWITHGSVAIGVAILLNTKR
jgi:hypothetical protein